MGRIADYLIRSLITPQVTNKGIVVWYDPTSEYKEIAQSLEGNQDFTFVQYQGSFFKLRKEVEPLLQGFEPPKLLVYIPKAPGEVNHALIELESAGVSMYPGKSSTELNTRLESVARAVLKKVVSETNADLICKQIAEGMLSLDELEKIVDQGASVGNSNLNLVFDTTDPIEITLKFLSIPALDKDIVGKNLLPEVVALFKNVYGFEVDQQLTVNDIRNKLVYFCLLQEFVQFLEETPQKLSQVIPTIQEFNQINLRKLLSLWRHRTDFNAEYIKFAKTVETSLQLESLKIRIDKLTECETFCFVEKELLKYAAELVAGSKTKHAFDISIKRRQSFWAIYEPQNGFEWSIIEMAAMLVSSALSVENELKGRKNKLTDFIDNYTREDNPWYLIDTYHRDLEQKYERFDLGLNQLYLEKMIVFTRQKYMSLVNDMTVKYCEAFVENQFNIDWQRYIDQRSVFKSFIEPQLGKQKVAYVLVDALRYEMAVELLDGLKSNFEINLLPAIATLPTITEIGMSALLPGAEGSCSIEEAGKGKVALNVNGEPIKNRSDRVKQISSRVGQKFADFKVDQLQKPTKSVRSKLDNADFILVTSREIDSTGEEENSSLSRTIMSEVLEQIRRTIRNLSQLGFSYIVICSDHGYLYADELNSGHKIDPPGGKTVDLHRRVWIGQGGGNPPAVIRVNESKVGLGGPYELVFTKGFNCFKAGGSLSYLHGGISLQEMVIPVAQIQSNQLLDTSSITVSVEITLPKPEITTRFFVVQVKYSPQELFAPEKSRIKVLVMSGKELVGDIVAAVYGFEGSTQEIELEKNQVNSITVLLKEEIDIESLDLIIVNADTLVEIGRRNNVKVKITF